MDLFPIVLPILVLAYAADGALTPNEQGAPQEIRSLVCSNRSSACSVLLDVPSQCAGARSECPIGFFFHGHGGRNEMYPNWAGWRVHEYGFIGVYPQGEIYNGQSGWNDGSMAGNKCAWNDFDCQSDPNDPVFTAGIITVLRHLGAQGRIYMWGESNGANEVQILAANAGDSLPLAGIAAGWGQLMSAPPRSGPSPYNYNQPAAPGTGSRPGDGRPIAQLAHHGDGDHIIPYTGGPRFGSRWILMPEPQSDETWKSHNGCTGNLTSSEVPATYRNHQWPHNNVNTTAVHWVWGGCPPTAPVEYYQVKGAPHGGANTINGRDAFFVVFDFWKKVEAAHEVAIIV